ncbi:HDIG domain-containing metalloprotein [Salidesulfovibrio brasiliensis]|uniref:HDIG domain-containing metalloprotein n=1 Tax=Salidesulfovibrio brasiliensis TaxID=221711 RepID=UPI0009FB51F8|nr:HD domain-containing protein [Salidesulfovibrio brasiliensis]
MKVAKTRYAFPPGESLPPPPGPAQYPLPVPTEEECLALWEETSMFNNVREHSFAVAAVATFLAERARELGREVNVGAVRASALLHDIAKTYSILYGGNHSQLGGAWVAEYTGNPVIASGVAHHVFWPFELDLERYFLQLAVLYADKRVTHDHLVPINERFEDLLDRYGRNGLIRERMTVMHEQVETVEELFSTTLKVDLNEYSLDSGRLVQRA